MWLLNGAGVTLSVENGRAVFRMRTFSILEVTSFPNNPQLPSDPRHEGWDGIK